MKMKSKLSPSLIIVGISAAALGFFGGALLPHGLAEAPTPAETTTPLSSDTIRAGLARLLERTVALKELIEQARARQLDPAYPLVTVTVLDNFVVYALTDLEHNEVQRAADQLAAMEPMAGRVKGQLRAALSGKTKLSVVPRYVTGPITISGPSFLAETTALIHHASRITDPASLLTRPVFFIGYGHFGQVRADVEKFPSYGVNIIQVEFGPSSVFPREGEVSDVAVRETLALLDRAAKANVAVNLLISPHYFPQWHRQMADTIHGLAPTLPVHAKPMGWTFFDENEQRFGVNSDLFSAFSQINGKGSVNYWSHGLGDWAQGGPVNACGHEWKPFEPARPLGRIEGWLSDAKTCDLQRLQPQVALLHSTAALVYDRKDYSECLDKLYEALSFTGLKVGFVTERQLQAGQVPKMPVLLVPNVRHLPTDALAALKQYRGKLVLVGDERVLGFDEYDSPRDAVKVGLKAEPFAYMHGQTTSKQLWEDLLQRLPAWRVRPSVDIRDADGKPVWGVVWLTAECNSRRIVNLINYRHEPVTIRLNAKGRGLSATGLFDANKLDGPILLRPLEPFLAEVDVLLFDGHSTAGWRGYKMNQVPEGWKVVNGALVRVSGGPGGKGAGGGDDLITVEQKEPARST
jgi:hypothetical protein